MFKAQLQNIIEGFKLNLKMRKITKADVINTSQIAKDGNAHDLLHKEEIYEIDILVICAI